MLTSTSNASYWASFRPPVLPFFNLSYIFALRSSAARADSIVGLLTASSSISRSALALTPLLGRAHFVCFYKIVIYALSRVENSRSHSWTYFLCFLNSSSTLAGCFALRKPFLLLSDLGLEVKERAGTDPRCLCLVLRRHWPGLYDGGLEVVDRASSSELSHYMIFSTSSFQIQLHHLHTSTRKP